MVWERGIRPGREMRRGFDLRVFLLGFAAGVFMMLGSAAAGVAGIADHGFTVNLDGEEIAQQVRREVLAMASREFPRFIATAKEEVPRKVAEQMAGSITGASLQISSFYLALPETATRQLEDYFQSTVRETLFLILDEIDTSTAAEGFAGQAYDMVKATLKSQFDGRTFTVSPFRYLSFPVTVRVQ